MSRKITVVSDFSGDWAGLYINNELKCEGHSLHFRDIFDALGEEFEHHEIEIEGSLPNNLPSELQ